jgi:hypothetical protein
MNLRRYGRTAYPITSVPLNSLAMRVNPPPRYEPTGFSCRVGISRSQWFVRERYPRHPVDDNGGLQQYRWFRTARLDQ